MIRWTPEKDAELRLLAGLPLDLLANEIGTTEDAICVRASLLGISLEQGNGCAEGCQARWRLRLPRMKVELLQTLKRLGLAE